MRKVRAMFLPAVAVFRLGRIGFYYLSSARLSRLHIVRPSCSIIGHGRNVCNGGTLLLFFRVYWSHLTWMLFTLVLLRMFVKFVSFLMETMYEWDCMLGFLDSICTTPMGDSWEISEISVNHSSGCKSEAAFGTSFFIFWSFLALIK